ncbi:MAG: hypothetical protein HWQ36_19410 [Nostoc sp. NMS2]|uniref:hypothetical protein n=1 Tax=Nostoc sp. NMS2 TaxID=2815389 RepID=UPI0025E85C44|nr:hypothetical protein [Nostoc sp. NMS2]MBN3992617.1 hypothetical protein [Nostoc sp. NMS2]
MKVPKFETLAKSLESGNGRFGSSGRVFTGIAIQIPQWYLSCSQLIAIALSSPLHLRGWLLFV